MTQQMTMEQGHTPDDWIGEVHDEVNCPAKWDIDSIEPLRHVERNSVYRVNQEMNLVNVEGM